MEHTKVTHVIFDIDGLLLDTEKIYEEIIGNLALKYGGEYTEEVRQKVLGRMEQDTIKILKAECNLNNCTEEVLMEAYVNSYVIELQKATLMPGAERLIRHLAKYQVPMALATSSSRISIPAKTKNFQDLFKLFHHLVSGTSDADIKNSKPAPDIFLVCASKFPNQPKPSQCLVFEDSPSGVEAAILAGMLVVMVPDPRITVERRKNATIVLNSLEEFKPELFGLPPF